MTLEDLRCYCLAKPSSTEDLPFGPDVLVFRIGGKIFALTDLERFPPAVNLKCDPESASELRERFMGIEPGYHMNKKHWNTIHLAADVPTRKIEELIDHSYDLVFRSLRSDLRRELSGKADSVKGN
jgi:predicted DNA-binding protein (MmcQ/YjbR family)